MHGQAGGRRGQAFGGRTPSVCMAMLKGIRVMHGSYQEHGCLGFPSRMAIIRSAYGLCMRAA